MLQPNPWSRRSKLSAEHAGIAAGAPDPVATPVSRVARGSFTALGVYVAGAGLTYCSQLLIARMVGAETYGVYAYVFACMTVLAYCSALGFDVAVLRFVPAYAARQAWALLRGVIEYAQRRALIAGICTIITGGSLVLLQSRQWSPELEQTFLVGFMLVPVWALLWIRCAIVRGFGGVVSALAPDRMVRDGMLLALVALASIGLRWTLDAPLVMLATVVSSALALGLAGLAMNRLHPRAIDGISPAYAAETWRGTALPLVIIAAAEALMNRTGVVLLGWLGHTTETAIYSVVFNMAFVVTLPRAAVNTLFAPTISGLFAGKDRAMLQVLITRAASWAFGGGACIALALSILAEPLLGWFGADYVAGAPVLRILVLGQVIAAGAGSQLYVMTMTGHERCAAILLVLSTSANAVATLVLISWFGLIGAGIATTITLILWNAVMALFVWRRLKLLPSVLALFQPLCGRKADCYGHPGAP